MFVPGESAMICLFELYPARDRLRAKSCKKQVATGIEEGTLELRSVALGGKNFNVCS